MQVIPDDVADKAATLIEPFEGFSSTPYPDPGTGAEPWTYGYGSTRDLNGNPVTASTPAITSAQAALILSRDVHTALLTIAQEVNVPLTTNEWAALGSLIYNIGAGNFGSSTLLKLLNAKDYEGAALQFERWDMAGGKVIAGLLRRRQAEMNLFNTPGQTSST